MKDSFTTRLHTREIRDAAVRSTSYRKLYTDRGLINDLDIVNELDGHSGCVNALSWSKSGRLLASGSDDLHLNIHSYHPDNALSQFQLTATVATGHTQNIFSVKFMPHSNDRTVITAAGDAQVRIFDLEYAGQSRGASHASHRASEGRRRGRDGVYGGVKYLSDGDTNARVYRSHGDRVKRIVTESSPHLFLTCSEDGEVRQWDLRQPSSAYPPPGPRYSNSSSLLPPPALISYKRYSLDLNSISCSASQPHYIALGGAHLHCFLHDRRMTGRDKLAEMGRLLSPIDQLSPDEQELLGQATQCVRKFAPKGQRKMQRADNGHITACKISDARPDEMIASWSGDQIYSFDLIRESSVDQEDSMRDLGRTNANESRDRKRKRQATGSEASLGQKSRPPRTDGTSREAALRIRYQNGQSEDIDLPDNLLALTERQRNAQRIAKASVKIRTSLFGNQTSSDTLAQFTSALGQAASILPDVDEVMREWGYPMDPQPDSVYAQQTMRQQRESTRRFVQGAGTLARVLGGKLQTPSGNASPMLQQFYTIETRSSELPLRRNEEFLYDFLKALLLWLDSGVGRLIEGFTRPSDMPAGRKAAQRLPIPEADAGPESIDEFLVPFLLSKAGEEPIINVESNRFETDEDRRLFASQKAAVLSFAAAVKIPFADLSSAVVVLAEEGERAQAQSRAAAHTFWGRKAARGLLLAAAEGLGFVVVDRAFGGLGRVIREVAAEEAIDAMLNEEEDEEEEVLSAVEVVDANGHVVDGATANDISLAAREARQGESNADGRGSPRDDVIDPLLSPADPGDEDDDNDHDDDDDDDAMGDDESEDEDYPSDSSSEPDEEDGVPNVAPRYAYRTGFERRKLRPKVEAETPCSGPTRQYSGHCNVRTVKDVNYFGPDDEYVISGSDCGNFFIWDRKTSELVNILEGDGEVVNVIQGHPYETMLAVSGIDHTIKIFSPDARAREVARLGRGISAHDASSFSSIAWPMRIGGRRPRRRESETATGQDTTSSEPAETALSNEQEADLEEDYVARNGLSSRKRMHDHDAITRQNDVERAGGTQEAAITVRDLLSYLLARGDIQ